MSVARLVAIRPPMDGANAFASDLLEGLHKNRKSIPSKYFYDSRGSALFERICELPEYYPTRTELGLLRSHAEEIAGLMGSDVVLVEYGAGAQHKVALLLRALHNPRAYIPVDISGDYLRNMAVRLSATRPGLPIHPVIADFTRPFDLPRLPEGSRPIGFFPGSTIGNLDRAEALAFLSRAARMLKGGGILIGVDLVKDPRILHEAYNDSAGITEAFNKNVLARANRELGTNFDPEKFAHYAFYNPEWSRIEMHLMCLARQVLRIAGHEVLLSEGETIHTENSHKYTVEGFRSLAREAGFQPREVWCDPSHLFSLHWLAVPDGKTAA